MTRTAFSAVLLCLGALLFHEPSHAAQTRPIPAFRAPIMPRPAFRPQTQRPPAVFHPVAKPLPHHLARHRFPHRRFVPVLAGSLVPIFGGTPLSYSEEPAAEQAPSGPALVRAGATVGCQMEDVTVPGNGEKAVVTIIRC
jgi:hypothetical protein